MAEVTGSSPVPPTIGKEFALALVIPQEIKQTIGFIFTNREGAISPELTPVGTGFFVGIKEQDQNLRLVYFVTAKHVLTGLSEVYVRLNIRGWDPGSENPGYSYSQLPTFDTIGRGSWITHSDPTVDIAVLPWAPDQSSIEYKVINLKMFVTEEVMLKEKVAEGDEIFFVGLLPQYYKTKRNQPITRYGRLSLVTNEKVETQEGPADLLFAECQSFPGNSGSPVFLQFGPIRQAGTTVVGGGRLMLLGIMKGYFRETGKVSIHPVTTLELAFQENIGIAAVVPVQKLHEILFLEVLVQQRESEKAKSTKI